MFGPLTQERQPLAAGRGGRGIGGYGNCIGVPTVGGEIHFASPHSANPTVNVMCVGIAPANGLMTSTSHTAHAGSSWCYSAPRPDATGSVGPPFCERDPRGGFENLQAAVQIGDPFAGKLLIEASLEMVRS